MRNRLFLVVLQLCCCVILTTAQEQLKPIAAQLAQLKTHTEFAEIVPFRVIEDRLLESLHEGYVSDQIYLNPDPSQIQLVQDERPELLRITLPGRSGDITLELFRKDIFADGYVLNTSEGPAAPRNDMVFYHGIKSGNNNSLAIVSFIGDQVRLLYADHAGNRRIQPTEGGRYVAFHDLNLKLTASYECGVDDSHVTTDTAHQGVESHVRSTGDCVEIYFECDMESYTDNNSSIPETEGWVAALFNEVSTLYDNESISIGISEIFIWTTPDPYLSNSSTSAALSTFRSEIATNGYNGRLAHLLSTRGLGGGIAYVDVLCSSVSQCAVSASLSTNIVPFPTQTWNVTVVAHELGHNFGSRHTHRCVWNGNSTQIDDCGNEWANNNGNTPEGASCYDENNPILPSGSGGTIMSYCHLVSGVGINFNNGFGPLPGDLIRAEFAGASCNTGSCGAPACASLDSPTPGSTNVETNEDVSWVDVFGANGYILNIGTSAGGGQIVNDLDVGDVISYDPGTLPGSTEIFVEITPYNLAGNATGCSISAFTTESSGPPQCTQLTSPSNGASNVALGAVLQWEHASGSQQGYKVRVGTTPGSGDIANNVDVGNVTTYDPGPLPIATEVFVRITPYGSGGDTQGCTEESFTTVSNLQYCSSQGNIITDEWIAAFTFGSFTNTSGASQYTDYTSNVIDVSIGESYTISATPGFSGQTWPEYFRVWIDYNKDGDFSDTGEQIFSQGPTTSQVSGSYQIPATASSGLTTLRVTMKYNGTPDPCETFDYGEVEDYTINIGCNVVINTNDSGSGSLRYAAGCVDAGETITFSNSLQGQTILLTGTDINISDDINIIALPGQNITISAIQAPRVFDIFSSATVIVEGLSIVGGTSNASGAIRNNGDLTLRDISVLRNQSEPANTLILNQGTLSLEGICEIED